MTACRADAISPITETLMGSFDLDKRDSGLVNECRDLLALPRDCVAFWIVLIIGCDIARGFDNVIKSTRESRGASDGGNSKFVQSDFR